jgi:NADPH:quinone reductase-like Zn-dependent oxidoreductase
VAEARAATALQGIDAVLALAGGRQLERCLDFVKPGGRVVYPNGVEPAPEARRGIRLRSYDGVPDPQHFAALGRRIAAMRLRVPIVAQYPLSQADRAHRRLEQGQVAGRIVLRIRR